MEEEDREAPEHETGEVEVQVEVEMETEEYEEHADEEEEQLEIQTHWDSDEGEEEQETMEQEEGEEREDSSAIGPEEASASVELRGEGEEEGGVDSAERGIETECSTEKKPKDEGFEQAVFSRDCHFRFVSFKYFSHAAYLGTWTMVTMQQNRNPMFCSWIAKTWLETMQ